jgi:small subunit ribosomal protein S8
MSLSDPIADMLTRIRNGVRADAKTVKIRSSKMCIRVAEVLKNEGYIGNYDVIDDGRQGILRITLKYGPNGERVIQNLKRESKPGCRRYRGVKDVPQVLNGLGIVIVSTSRGVLSDRQCRELHIGGELICSVY